MTNCIFSQNIINKLSSDYSLEFRSIHLPIKLCFATIINEAQGQALKEVGSNVHVTQPSLLLRAVMIEPSTDCSLRAVILEIWVSG